MNTCVICQPTYFTADYLVYRSFGVVITCYNAYGLESFTKAHI